VSICIDLWLVVLLSQVIQHEIDQRISFFLRQDVAEGDHAVAAVGDVVVDLVAGGVFVLAVADVWYYAAIIERSSRALRRVTDGTILAEK